MTNECGCKAWHDRYGEWHFQCCPMHGAAEDMYKALKAIVERHEQGLALGEELELEPARQALQKAEGKQ